MSLRRTPAAAATAVLAALSLAACGSAGTGAAAADDGVLTVVTSTDVYGSIVRAIGGQGVTVESLIDDPAADPHSYESTPTDAATVAGADVVVLNGGGYDDFMRQLVDTAQGDRVVLDVTELSGLESHAEEPAAEADEHGHAHGEFNEHVWYSLPTVQTLAERLATELGTLDAAGAATYQANAEAFGAQVTELHDRVTAIGQSVPGARVAVTEPMAGHLIESAGLTDVTPPEFSEAVEEDTDPPAAVLAETLGLFSPGNPDPVRALIVNAQTVTPTTDQVRGAAEQVGTPVIEMTETLPDGQDDYLAWMNAQVDALSAALSPV